MGKIKIERLNNQQREDLLIPGEPRAQEPWAVWECAPSAFEWYYDQEEKAYLYEGRVNVVTSAETVEIKAGDYVTFPKGLSCRWDVLETIRKVYKFE